MGVRRPSRSTPRRRAILWPLALIAAGTALLAQGQPAGKRVVYMLTIDGDVNPVLVGYVERGIQTAEKHSAEMLLIRLDTPGGQLEGTRKLAQDFLASQVPVGVYVWPPGARAGSAGTFITIGAHVAAMAPSTNIGAAHPVFSPGPGGEEQGDSEQTRTLTKKVTNDAVALIRNLAEARGRDGDWAEKAVRESVSATATEAARSRVVDFIADDVNDFLKKSDGRRVKLAQGERVLHTAGATVIELPMNWREALLMNIANPNVAYILMILGIYGLIIEMKSPSFGGAGIMGAICLILGLFALSVLPVNVAGLALIIVGVGFFVAELYAPTHGLLTLGGTIALAIGSLILINSPDPSEQVSRPLIAGVVTATVVFFVFCLGAIVRGQRRKVVTGQAGMVGLVGEARTALSPEGTVYVDGAWWTAEAEEEPIEAGAKVEVVAVDGLRLTVRPAPPDDQT